VRTLMAQAEVQEQRDRRLAVRQEAVEAAREAVRALDLGGGRAGTGTETFTDTFTGTEGEEEEGLQDVKPPMLGDLEQVGGIGHVIIIGVASVYIQYNCVYYCDTCYTNQRLYYCIIRTPLRHAPCVVWTPPPRWSQWTGRNPQSGVYVCMYVCMYMYVCIVLYSVI
jgi:hypothetical protein